jgi:hypothetical protein
VFFAALLAAFAASIASADGIVTGYIKTGPEPAVVDSTYFEYGSQMVWFQTAGWKVDPMQTDTFVFPLFPGFPAVIKVDVKFGGLPYELLLNRPNAGEWYPFLPPHNLTQVMFDFQVGVEEGRNVRPGARFTVNPSVIREGAVIKALVAGRVEVADAAGNRVRRFAQDGTGLPFSVRWAADDDAGRTLPEGVYFCRLTAGQTVTVRKVTIAR